MEDLSKPSSALSEDTQVTSYWLSQHSAAFLMHLKDISTRIDPENPKHAQLRSHIKTYLQTVQQIQNSLVEGEAGKKEVDKEGVASLERRVEELSVQVNDLTAKLLESKLTNISTKQKKVELEKTFLRYMQSIYNPTLVSLNQVLTEKKLPYYKQNSQETITKVNQFLENNCHDVDQMIQSQKEVKVKLSKEKVRLSEEITGMIQKYKGNLFPIANRRYETTAETLEKIAKGEKQLAELEGTIGELEQVQNRKLTTIASYKQGIDMMSKPSEEDNFSTEGSSDLELQKTHSETLDTNPQIVFHQAKPNPYVHVLLAVWFVVLAAATLVLAID